MRKESPLSDSSAGSVVQSVWACVRGRVGGSRAGVLSGGAGTREMRMLWAVSVVWGWLRDSKIVSCPPNVTRSHSHTRYHMGRVHSYLNYFVFGIDRTLLPFAHQMIS